jgi:hypothetical protein
VAGNERSDLSAADFLAIARGRPIYDEPSASQRSSMEKFCSDKEDIARFVRKLLRNLDVGSQLTIVIERDKFAEYFVTGATSSSSVETPPKVSPPSSS